MRIRPARAPAAAVEGQPDPAPTVDSMTASAGVTTTSVPAAAMPHAARIIAFSAIATTMTVFGQTPGVSVFIDSLIEDLSISRAEISTVYSIASLGAAFLMPWAGRQIDTRGVRLMALVFATLFGAVLLGLSQVWEVAGLALGFFGIRVLGQGALNLTARVAVALRFRTSLGRAVGISGALGAIGLSSMPVILSALIERFDWRAVWAMSGLAVWAVVIPLTLWAWPRGADRAMAAAGRRLTAARTDLWTRDAAIRTGMFWAITLTVSTNALVITGLTFHQISLLGEAGLSPTRAAANYLPQTVATVIAIATVGAVADRLPGRLILVVSMTFLALATLMVQFLDDGLIALAYGLLLGAAGGTGYAAEGVLYPRYFGTHAIAAIRGIGFTMIVGAAAIGPVIVGVAEELTGGYTLAAGLLMLLPISVAVGTLAVRAPAPPGGRGPIPKPAG